MMKKTTLKILSMAFIASLCLAPACDKKEENGEKSGLIGRFVFSESIYTTFTNAEDFATKGEAREYTYTSSTYPMNTIVEEPITYETTQQLRLKRDYTYEYKYDIRLRKVTENGNTELAKLSVSTVGTFTYVQHVESTTDYTVTLSNPTEGKEEFYASHIVGEGNVFSWQISANPTYVLNVADVLEQPEPAFDRYLRGRTVEVVKAESNVLTDNVYFADLMNDFAPYFSYTSENDETENKPEIPDDPTTPETTIPVTQSAVLPYLAQGDSGMSVALAVADGYSLYMRAPVDSTVTVEGNSITADKNGVYVFPIDKLVQNYTVQCGDNAVTVSPVEYLRTVISSIPQSFGGTDEEMTNIQNGSLAVSILHLAALQEGGIALTDDEKALVFASNGVNYYHGDFGKRDNFDVTESDKAVTGFAWQANPTENTLLVGKTAGLQIGFSLPEGHYANVGVQATVNGKPLTATLQKVGAESGTETYSVIVSGIAPVDYAETVTLLVYDGETRISSRLEYSVNRAIAKADLSSDGAITDNAKMHYSLGKSTAWVAYGESVTKEYQPAIGNGSGSYTVNFGEYSQTYSFTAPRQDPNGIALYVGGTIVSDANVTVETENFSAQKTDGEITVTLNGGEIDGIFPATGNKPTKITVVVTADTTLNKVIVPMWGVGGDNASLRADCPLTITSTNGAKLILVGSIVADDLTVDGATVEVNSTLNVTPVTCNRLTIIHNGGLKVRYANPFVTVTSSGIVSKGDVSIDGGTLSVEGYVNGLWLEGGFTAKSANVYVKATQYAVNGSAPTDSESPVNRELVFTSGDIYLEGNNGTKYADITVDGAKVIIVANNGYTVDAEDASRPVTFKTVSGSEKVGEVTLINNTFNEYWDVYYTLKTQTLSLNGGKVTIFGMCRDGVVNLPANAQATIANCDLTVSNGHNMHHAVKAFNMNAGGASVTVENTAYVLVKDFQVIANAWANPATFVNNGMMILDGYACSLEQWELTAWELKLTMTNNGVIRYTNKAE